MKICVVKLGTAVVTAESGVLDVTLIRSICEQVAHLQRNGWQVIMISSGAVASGRSMVKETFTDVQLLPQCQELTKRELAALGQSKLLGLYTEYLYEQSSATGKPLHAAQVLLTRDAFERRNRYVSVRDTLLRMVEHDIVPIINNNDVLHEDGYDFPDNDLLAAYISGMIDAECMLLLTDIAGVFDRNPKTNGDAKRVPLLVAGEDWSESITIDDKTVSSGGMAGKLHAFRLMARLGIHCCIVPGKVPNILTSVLLEQNRETGTFLELTSASPVKGFRRWLATGARPVGVILVSSLGADVAIANLQNRNSLLLAGVTEVFGDFPAESIVALRSEEYKLLGIGRTKLSANEIRLKLTLSSSYEDEEVVNADYLLAISDDISGSSERPKVLETAKALAHARKYVCSGENGELELRISRIVSENGERKKCSEIVARWPFTDAQALREWSRQAARILQVTPQDWLLFACSANEVATKRRDQAFSSNHSTL